jgi:heavy metal sensor kinase
MSFISKAWKAWKQIRQKQLPPSSLQFRLTIGITAVSVLGLGGVAIWTSWTMQQLLVDTHTQNVQYIADRFPRDVELYDELLASSDAVERAIRQADTSPQAPAGSLFIWVKDPTGGIIAESRSLQTASDSFSDMLMALVRMPIKPQVYQVSDRYLVLYSAPLVVDAESLGQLYMAQDITTEQLMLSAVIRRVSIATVLAILLLTVTIAWYIRRSLRPLRQINQLVQTISVDDLSQARLCLDRAPAEVLQLAQTFDEMLSRLSESWEQQRQFVSNVSHELRTPLTVVSGYLQSMMRRCTTLSTPQREALEIAAAETDRTIRLLQDLLDLARADSGYMHLHLEPVVLNNLVAEIVGMGEKFSDRTIQMIAPSAAIQIKTDRDRLTQVLVNLIDNAVKYSDPQAPILVKLAQSEAETTIQVCDRGCGIPLHQQTRIFERFYRVDEARARCTGGVGLGLAIVKSLIEGMGGSVTVWSKSGQGTTFTITLPSSPSNL